MSDDNSGYQDTGRITCVRIGDDHGSNVVLVGCEGPGWGQGLHLACDSREEAASLMRSIEIVFDVGSLEGEEVVVLRAFGYHDEIGGLRSVKTGRTWSLEAWRKKRGHPDAEPLARELKRATRDHEWAMRKAAEAVERIVSAESRCRRIVGEAP